MHAFARHASLLLLCLIIVVAGPCLNATSTMTHSNFLRASVKGGRYRQLWCSDDPTVCLDLEKNPWGGTTCCFQRFCKDTINDPDHCGDCGHQCAYAMMCCSGKCVDVRNDPHHCGLCYQVCPGQLGCSFAMCDYSGG